VSVNRQRIELRMVARVRAKVRGLGSLYYSPETMNYLVYTTPCNLKTSTFDSGINLTVRFEPSVQVHTRVSLDSLVT